MKLVRMLLCAFALAPAAAAADWTEDVLDVAARLPVLDEGRLKPLSTYADFTLLQISHRRSWTDREGVRRKPMEWLLDVLFFPEKAKEQHVFRVTDHHVFDDLGLDLERREGLRYSYRELEPAAHRLSILAQQYAPLDSKDRTTVQQQILDLWAAFHKFRALLHYFDFARGPLVVAEERMSASQALARYPELLQSGGAGALGDALDAALGGSFELALLPPMEGVREDLWLSPRDVAAWTLSGRPAPPEQVDRVRRLETLYAAREDPARFREELEAFHASTSGAARELGAYDKIELEVSYYALDPFYRSIPLFLLAFVLVAVGWLRPWKGLATVAFALTAAGLALTTAGIVIRCILRSHPPVSTLYETVIFVTAVAVLACLVIEAINRRRIALALAPVLGMLGLFVANKFEVVDRKDTMPQLQAVLRTNFWLTVHVLTITTGYAATLLASAIAHVHVLGSSFGFRRGDSSFYRGLTRMVYGVICFALFFSLFGTIAGGIWANDSWGRFWGWDPKENGALLIVLTQLAMLHGRMGGHLRDRGFAMSAIFAGVVVGFSWWGVNLLGVGLHSYGFTHGVMVGLMSFYAVEALVLAVGFGTWFARRLRERAAAAA